MTNTEWWVCNGEIVSIAAGEFTPADWIKVEGIDLPRSQLYFDGRRVVEKPRKPSENHFWVKDKWVILNTQIPILKGNRWTNFLLAIIQTAAYEKIKNFLSSNNPAEYTVLVALLNNSAIPDEPREKLLEGSLRKVKAVMKDSPTPLSSKDVGTINSLLQSELGVSWDISG